MARKRHTAEEIVGKLRQAELELGTRARRSRRAVRRIGASSQ
jgi:hypothetical protein